MKITITTDVTLGRIGDLLTTALEGGSTYWVTLEDKITPEKWISDGEHGHYLYQYPLEGGALILSNAYGEDGEATINCKLDLRAIQAGLQKMADKHPQAFGDFISENEDAETGDIFLQLCVLGEVIYG